MSTLTATTRRPGSDFAAIRVFARRFLDDYRRNPINLVLLALVPTVFVIVVAASMADAAKLLGGVGGVQVETASAGWAAAFLSGIAMYFQVAATGNVDRRIVLAGFPAKRLVVARLMAGVALAAVAASAALLALVARGDVAHPARVIAGTLMFAVIYIAIGALVGALVRNPVNGSVIVLFIWILDVFFGPAMGAADRVATRALPTHFVTLWMVDLPSGHGGQLTDLGWALVWTIAAVAVAWVVASRRITVARPRSPGARPGSTRAQSAAAVRAAWRDSRRNPAQWALFAAVPVVFILVADAVTPDEPITLTLAENGGRVARTISMVDVHGATMAPIAIAALAAIVGLFTMVDSRPGDRRAALAGMSTRALLTARLAILTGSALAATAVSLAVTATIFDAARWGTYVGANVLLALTYALVGALLAPLVGRVGGVFVAFLLPFLDIGIAQSPMLHTEPTTLSRLLPGYGGSRVLLDGALTRDFDETLPLVAGVGWLAALLVAVYLTYRHATRPTGHKSDARGGTESRDRTRLPVGPVATGI